MEPTARCPEREGGLNSDVGQTSWDSSLSVGLFSIQDIRESLGCILEVYISFVHTGEKWMARILVSLNPWERLTEEINLKYREFSYT